MFNDKMYELGSKRSAIRELFEFGKMRKKEVGDDCVFDFSLGNPNVPAPKCVNDAVRTLLEECDDTTLHGYTSAQGAESVRLAVANNLKVQSGLNYSKDLVYMTCGAAASLCITLRALCEEGDEFIVLAPYFPEYKVFISSQGGKCVEMPFDCNLNPNLDALNNAISKKTKAVIINSPNNPSGVIYTQDTIDAIAKVLAKKSIELNTTIFIISDEPYRELAYDVQVPAIACAYNDTITCYSYSKSLSLPGERIGYIAISPNCTMAKDIYLALCGAGRALGYVCAPSTYQKVVEKCIDAKPDIQAYRKNRDLLYHSLCQIGYECVRPDGAFYLLFKSLEPSSQDFCQRAKQYDLLLVACDDFGAQGYVRAAYCVDYAMIARSIGAFEKLYNSYKK